MKSELAIENATIVRPSRKTTPDPDDTLIGKLAKWIFDKTKDRKTLLTDDQIGDKYLELSGLEELTREHRSSVISETRQFLEDRYKYTLWRVRKRSFSMKHGLRMGTQWENDKSAAIKVLIAIAHCDRARRATLIAKNLPKAFLYINSRLGRNINEEKQALRKRYLKYFVEPVKKEIANAQEKETKRLPAPAAT